MEKERTAAEVNAAVHGAIGAYIEKHGPDVGISDLGSFIRAKTGADYAGPALARMLLARGYEREGIRKIDTCPGKTTFYVPAKAQAISSAELVALLDEPRIAGAVSEHRSGRHA